MKYKFYAKIGAAFTLIFGTLLHFSYDFFNEEDFVAIFSAVNESTWEHLKLLFFPVMIFAIAEYFLYGKNLSNFWTSKVTSLIAGMFSIVVMFYTYTGIIGKSINFLNISVFIIATILTYWLFRILITLNFADNPTLNKIAMIVAVAIFVLFWVYTFYPPLINLFRDPVTGGFGI